MNYNDFTYYRANPYARQGYIPPIAHTNRHKVQFATELPMGEQHLGRIGKRQYGYGHGGQRSNIESESILKSPERYPFENRIALEKGYERNLNTIDIEGASSGTLVSPAVRNKLKAREELIRRQKELGSNHIDQLQHLENTEEERRRQIAYQQYLRNQQIQQLNSGKLIKPQNYETLNQGANNEGSQLLNSYHRRQQKRMATPERYPSQLHQKSPSLPRYQSIDTARPSFNPEAEAIQNTKPTSNINELQMSESQQFNNWSVEANNDSRMRVLDRKQLRQQNPTILSSENSMYLAGRNIVGS